MIRTRQNMQADLDARLPAGFCWDYETAEIVADAIVHGCAVALALTGATALLVVTQYGFDLRSVGVLTYAGSLVGMFSLSAVYNLWPVGPTKWMLRRVDHAAIYFFIAASATPILAGMAGVPHRTALLWTVWIGALAGALIKLLLPGRLEGAALGFCILLGCLALFSVCRETAISHTAEVLALLGGVLYALGLAFHLSRNLRFHNAGWHTLVLFAACCQYFAVWSCAVAHG